MADELRLGVMMALPLMLQLIGLTYSVLIDPYILKKRRNILLLNVVLMVSLIATDLVSTLLVVAVNRPLQRTLVSIFGYVVRPLVILLFCYIVSPDKRCRASWVLVALNTGIYLTALFSPLAFSITPDNSFRRGPLGYASHIICGLLLLNLLFLTLREYGNKGKMEALIPIFNAVVVIAAVALDTFIIHTQSGITMLSIAMVSCSLFYYIWLHLQFVREHEEALMAEQRIQIMMTQIQPHFLYNTLSTIQALCRKDPEKAFDVTEKFGTYLRQNLASLRRTERIPVSRELEHTRIYSEIEEIRFPNVHVEYDIQDADFLLPALTIQPLVENAIRHGVRIRKSGVVTVSTRIADGCHEIVIRDNGKGFDAALVERADETHIGICNVRERVEKLCGGTLRIESVIGEGTAVTLRLPM